MPLFLADNGMVYMPTARHVWDQLLAANMQVRSILDAQVSQAAFAEVAERCGGTRKARLRCARAGAPSPSSHANGRRPTTPLLPAARSYERIGLPQVRNYRLNLLAQEERSFQKQLDQKAHAYPEMVPLLVIRVEGGGHE